MANIYFELCGILSGLDISVGGLSTDVSKSLLGRCDFKWATGTYNVVM